MGKGEADKEDSSRMSLRALVWESGFGIILLTKIRTHKEGVCGERLHSL